MAHSKVILQKESSYRHVFARDGPTIELKGRITGSLPRKYTLPRRTFHVMIRPSLPG